MIIELFGVSLILISSLFTGIAMRSMYKCRLMMLEDFEMFLSKLENEIRYLNNDIAESFKKERIMCHVNNEIFINEVYKRLCDSEGEKISSIWNDCVGDVLKGTCYKKEDVDIISDFGDMLGCGDKQTQLNNIDYFRSKLRLQYDSAKAEFETKGSAVVKFCVCVGAVVTIFFI